MKYVYREIASQPKQFRLFGRVNGHKNDYGHDDLVIGKHARQEVYPTILEWLDDFPVSTSEQPLPLQPGVPGQGDQEAERK